MSSKFNTPITVRLDSFEGPLDLLLYLIQEHELDISTVSVSKVTDQYLMTIRMMQELNFDLASEFLLIAATLILWKSKAILPPEDGIQTQPGEDMDLPLTPEELLRQLLEHQRFLAAGQDLNQQLKLGEDVFNRPNKKPPIERIWREMNISDLALGYQDMLVRERRRNRVLKKETVSLSEKIKNFAQHLEVGKITAMKELITEFKSRPEWVVTFLASLELARLKKLKVYQEQTYADIYLELLETLQNFNIGLATGFDLPQPATQPTTQPQEQEQIQEGIQ